MEHPETEQYRRHLCLKGFGEEKQKSLKKSSVLVVGAGGLGCATLQYLVAAGVGKLGIIDDDKVEISNLQRQILFNHNDLGLPKAEVAASKLLLMNPFIEIHAHQERLTKENCGSFFKDYEIVIDGSDNFPTRYLINDACVLFDKPLVHGSINQFEGMVSVFNFNKGPTYRCLFPEQPDPTSIPTCTESGVLGVLPGIIGCWQALEAIKIITGLGEALSGKVLLYNALTQSTRIIQLHTVAENRLIKALPDPIVSCHNQKQNSSQQENIKEISMLDLHEMMQVEKALQILDVREDWERAQYSIQPSIHKPLGNLLQGSHGWSDLNLDPDKKLVIYCKAGIRSKMACEALHTQGFSNLFNLSEGMDGWLTKFPEI